MASSQLLFPVIVVERALAPSCTGEGAGGGVADDGSGATAVRGGEEGVGADTPGFFLAADWLAPGNEY